MDKIRILLVDDHQVVRDGLRHALQLEPDMEIAGEAGEAKEALALVESLKPEIVLMDIKMPGVDGLELTRQMKEKQPELNIIMLTMYDEYLPQAIEAGAVGYLLKDIKRDELIRSIRAVKQGRAPIALSLTRNGLAELAANSEGKQKSILTEREYTILKMIAEGSTTKDLADKLFLSQASVKRSVGVIFDKLSVKNRSEAVAEAYKRKII